jgi:hypothetical protein
MSDSLKALTMAMGGRIVKPGQLAREAATKDGKALA